MMLVALVHLSPDSITRGTRVVLFSMPTLDDSLSPLDGFAKALRHRKWYDDRLESLGHSKEAAYVDIVESEFRAVSP